jgi:hypothetical protein
VRAKVEASPCLRHYTLFACLFKDNSTVQRILIGILTTERASVMSQRCRYNVDYYAAGLCRMKREQPVD